MPRIQSYSWALVALLSSLLLTVACGGGNPDDSGSAGDGGDGGVSEQIRMKVNASMLDEPVDCEVHAVDGSVSFPTGEWHEVDPGTQLNVGNGDSTLRDQFGYFIHVTDEGEYWAAPAVEADPDTLGDQEYDRDLFRVFEPGDYVCTRTGYRYDEGQSNFKGDQDYEVQDAPQKITINQEGYVLPDSTFGVFGSDNYLVIEDDTMQLETANGSDAYVIPNSVTISNTSFSVTIADPGYLVTDLHCSK